MNKEKEIVKLFVDWAFKFSMGEKNPIEETNRWNKLWDAFTQSEEYQSLPKEEVGTRGTFNEWYDKNVTRFHQSQFDAKEMGYSAYLFGLDNSVNQEEK